MQKLLELNKQGLFPGPNESWESFYKRAEYCLLLKNHLANSVHDALGSSEECPEQSLSKGFSRISALFGFSPKWIPVFFSNYKLAPWHGGCAWIFQLSEKEPTSALLQLRKKFRTSPSHLGIYHRDELIAHELVHAGRMLYEEPHFEEILACRTSSYAVRKWLGPIVQSSVESMLFVLSLVVIFILDIYLIFFHDSDAYISAMWLKLLPGSMLVYALIRLWNRQQCFDKCLGKLSALFGNQNAWCIIYRLKDEEIRQFAQNTTNAIIAYAEAEKTNSPRWQLIHAAYMEPRG